MQKTSWLSNGMRKRAKTRFSIGSIIGFMLLFLFLVIRIWNENSANAFSPVSNLRNQSFDYYQKLKPRDYTPQPVRIIDIDEESLQKIGQWPWPRTTIANMIENLGQAGAVVIGFDIVFAERDRLSPVEIAKAKTNLSKGMQAELGKLPDNEIAMRDAMRRTQVVLGETSVRNAEDRIVEGRPIRDVSFAQLGEDPRRHLPQFSNLVQNLEILNEAASGFGVFSVDQDPDGIIRRVPLIVKIQDKIRLALGAESLRVATGGDSFATKTNINGLQSIVLAGKEISTDRKGNIWPYFSTMVADRYIPASNIIERSFDPKKVNGHIVLVGTSAVGLEDYRSVPIGTRVPGVEIHAQIIENLLTDKTLHRPFYALAYELAAVALMGLLIIIAVPLLGAVWSGLLAIGTIAAIASISWYSFSQQLMLVDATWPILSTALIFIAMAMSNYIQEERNKQQIKSAFGQYLSPALVNRLSENPEQLSLGGSTRELTVLFTDVRGFTALAESYRDQPEGLTSLMNTFLTELSNPILKRDGTIDKYMGDAVMAFWNAPFDVDAHPEKACRAALDMIASIDALNVSRRTEAIETSKSDFQDIRVGIGINTGPCVVGNMGSENRFDYTALGDTVNIASRLEGQSKPYGLPIVIGPETAENTSKTFAVFEIDLIKVKGKSQPIKIYALAGDEILAQSSDFVEFRALNSGMIASFRAQDWEAAFEILDLLEELGEKLKLPVEEYLLIYRSRITEFIDNPPGANWDGVYSALSK